MATKTNHTKSKPKTQDAIGLLEQDHQTVRKLLRELEETTARGIKKREELRSKIAEEVRIHAAIEEEIFYPAFREVAENEEDTKLFFEATEEHGLVHIVLPALEDTDPTADEFGAKAKVLKDLIEHHAEEEESEMLPRARKLLGKERLMELGEQMQERKDSLKRTRGVAADAGRSSSPRSASASKSSKAKMA